MSEWEKCFVCPSLVIETIDRRIEKKQAKSINQACKQLEKESENSWAAPTIRQIYYRNKSVTNVTKTKKQPSYDTCTISDLNSLIESGKTFGTIYADPPWAYDNQGSENATSRHYNTLSIDEICDFPIKKLVADKAHLHLWTTNNFIFECPKIIEAWGFEYKSILVWIKNGLGMGNYWRVTHEFLITAIKGGLTFSEHKHKSWIEIPRGKHSAKPEEVARIIEKVSPGPYLELFGRNPRMGWVVYGNEIERTMFTEAAFG